MMMMRWGIAVFLFAGLVAAALLFEQSNAQDCNFDLPVIPPVEGLNMSRLESKRWYVQGKYFAKAAEVVEPTNKCYVVYNSGFYMPREFFFNENYVTETGGFRHREAWGRVAEEESDAAWWSISRSGHIMDYTTVYSLTDYENYGVIHWCPARINSPYVEGEHMLILTGSPQPEETLLTGIKEQLESAGYSTEHLVSYEHPDDCKYE